MLSIRSEVHYSHENGRGIMPKNKKIPIVLSEERVGEPDILSRSPEE